MKIKEKKIYLAFEISILLKGLHSLMELVGGFVLLFISQESIIKIIYYITQEELIEDPKNLVATFLLSSAQQLTIGGQHFAAIYLLIHGVVKFFLVFNLLKKKLWSYPLAIAVFGSFIFYQIYRFSITGSLFLIFLTILDVIVIVLTLHEYKYLKGLKTNPKK